MLEIQPICLALSTCQRIALGKMVAQLSPTSSFGKMYLPSLYAICIVSNLPLKLAKTIFSLKVRLARMTYHDMCGHAPCGSGIWSWLQRSWRFVYCAGQPNYSTIGRRGQTNVSLPTPESLPKSSYGCNVSIFSERAGAYSPFERMRQHTSTSRFCSSAV